MKIYKFLITGVFLAIIFATPKTYADIISENIGKLTSSVKNVKSKEGIRSILCKKADLKLATLSFRSFDGRLCVGPLGAFALLTCKNYSDKDGSFSNSHCYKKAIETVGRGDVNASAARLLINSAEDTFFKIIKPLVCTIGGIVLDPENAGSVLKATCGALDDHKAGKGAEASKKEEATE